MQTYVKYCGLRSSEDVKNAYLSGANGLGFVFANSKRQVQATDVAEWMKEGPYADCETFAVLVNPTEEDAYELLETVDVDVLQFHGEETVSFIKNIQRETNKRVVKALRHDRNTLDLMSAYAPVVDGFIVDAGTQTERGGTGKTFDWKKAPSYIHFAKQLNVPLYIAGGVHEENVQQLLEMQPDGIDVSSGIEIEGKKDDSKMKSIMRQVGDYATVLSGS